MFADVFTWTYSGIVQNTVRLELKINYLLHSLCLEVIRLAAWFRYN